MLSTHSTRVAPLLLRRLHPHFHLVRSFTMSTPDSDPTTHPPVKPGIPTISGIYASGPDPPVLPTFPSSTQYPFPLRGSTLDTHADCGLEPCADIAPPLHPSTTFHQLPPRADGHNYSRVSTVTRTRVEALLGAYEKGAAVTYASGLAAASALIHALRPRRIYSEAGYHGVKAALAYWQARQVAGPNAVEFLTDAQLAALASSLPPEGAVTPGEGGGWREGQEGKALDLIWLEAPNNPYASLADFAYFASIARRTGAIIVVDSTLSTPLGLQPLDHGAHVALHATTKYYGGHSDLLGGVLVTRDPTLYRALERERTVDGAVMGSLECWLLLRSLRTFHLRVRQQTASAMRVVDWLEGERQRTGKVVVVHHPCVKSHPSYELGRRYLTLPPATFAVEVRGGKEGAMTVAKGLRLFQMATSLGGVESLVDWRYQYDTSVSEGLLRLSIGVEEADDLIADLQQAFEQL